MPARAELEVVGLIVLIVLFVVPWSTLIRWAKEETKKPRKDVLWFSSGSCWTNRNALGPSAAEAPQD